MRRELKSIAGFEIIKISGRFLQGEGASMGSEVSAW
jgi:hypothetical protein